jgi:uncharacterized protein (TIGR03067 family)
MATWRWLAALWIVSLVVGATRADGPPDAVKELQKTWVVTSATRDGKALEDMTDATIAIGPKEMTLQARDGTKLTWPFTVDPARKPHAIDFRLEGGEGWLRINGTYKGIYELDGDSLKLCVGSGDERPTKFSDKGAALVVLKRQK